MGKRGGELKQQDDGGYYRVMVAVKGSGRYIDRKMVRVNRMVCEAFHGKAPSPLHDAAHENGDSRDNHYTNLRWRTRAENMANPLTIRRMVQTWTRKAAEA